MRMAAIIVHRRRHMKSELFYIYKVEGALVASLKKLDRRIFGKVRVYIQNESALEGRCYLEVLRAAALEAVRKNQQTTRI